MRVLTTVYLKHKKMILHIVRKEANSLTRNGTTVPHVTSTDTRQYNTEDLCSFGPGNRTTP